MKISFIIPIFNSEKTIDAVVKKIISVYKNSKFTIEIILIDDCSSDKSFSICKKIALRTRSVTVIQLTKNFGQHNALLTGMRFSKGDFIVCLDDDLQTPPEESIKLIQKLERDNLDVVFGKYDQIQQEYYRYIGSKLNDIMACILIGKPFHLTTTSYFATRKFIVNEIIKYNGPYPYLLGLILQATNKIGNVSIKHSQRNFGRSNYTFAKLVSLWFDGFTNFSIKPLQICTVTGFVISSLGFILAFFLVIRRILYPSIPLGYTSIILTIIILSGLNLMFIGLVGQYVGKIFLTVNKKPQSIIRKKIN